MRRAAGTPAGTAAFELGESIKRWRAAAHDSKRNVGSNQWLLPKDFIRRREAFTTLATEAQKLYRDISTRKPTTPKEKAERAAKEATANLKMMRAAQTLADPLLRNFLIGVAAYEGKNYALAESQFRKCCKAAPRVAAFYQGRGLALGKQDRHLDALVSFTWTLRLQPNSQAALRMLRDGLKNVPGAKMQTPAFQTATELVGQYEADSRRSSRSGIEWLLPGRVVRTRTGELPKPQYDRLVFRQAVAVPVGTSSLIVDEAAVKDAKEVFVRIDETTLVRGVIKRVRSYGSKRTSPPVALVIVGDCKFTPLEADPETKFAADEAVTAYGLGIYEQMGRTVRKINGKILNVEEQGRLQLSAALVAGEAASPIITQDGKLAGLLSGRTDAMADGGGAEKFIPLSELERILKQASRPYRRPSGYGRTRRNIQPRPAPGQLFIVYVTCTEKFEK